MICTQNFSQSQNRNFAAHTTVAVHSRPAHEEEDDFQDAYENRHYYKALDPDDFRLDRSWNFQCRRCERSARVTTKNPKCSYCDVTVTKRGA
jgi:hypothetical protein